MTLTSNMPKAGSTRPARRAPNQDRRTPFARPQRERNLPAPVFRHWKPWKWAVGGEPLPPARDRSNRRKGTNMISVIFCSRVKDNPDSNVRQLLDSAVDHLRADERDQIEFLIKYDDDDDGRPADSF